MGLFSFCHPEQAYHQEIYCSDMKMKDLRGRIPLGQQECSPLDSEQSGPLQSSHRTLLLWHLSHDVVVISMSFNPVRLWACPSEELNLRNICIQSIENSPLCIEAAE